MGISKGGTEAYLAAAVDPRIATVVPIIGVQSYRWALEHDQWRARVNTFWPPAQAAARSEGGDEIDAAFVRRFYDRVVPGIYGELDAPSVLPAHRAAAAAGHQRRFRSAHTASGRSGICCGGAPRLRGDGRRRQAGALSATECRPRVHAGRGTCHGRLVRQMAHGRWSIVMGVGRWALGLGRWAMGVLRSSVGEVSAPR